MTKQLTEKQVKQLRTLQKLYNEQNKNSDDYKIRDDFTLIHKLTAMGLGVTAIASVIRIIVR